MTVERTEEAALSGFLHLSTGGATVRLRCLTIEESDTWLAQVATEMAALDIVEPEGEDAPALLAALFREASVRAMRLVRAYDVDNAQPDDVWAQMTKRELYAALEEMVTVEDPFGEGVAHSVALAFGGPGRIMERGMAIATEPLRLVRSPSSPSPIGASTTAGTSGPAGPASSSSSTGRTRRTGSTGKPTSAAS